MAGDQEQINTRALETSVEAITLVRMHIQQCDLRAQEHTANLLQIRNDIHEIQVTSAARWSTSQRYLISLLITAIGFLFVKLMGWM